MSMTVMCLECALNVGCHIQCMSAHHKIGVVTLLEELALHVLFGCITCCPL